MKRISHLLAKGFRKKRAKTEFEDEEPGKEDGTHQNDPTGQQQQEIPTIVIEGASSTSLKRSNSMPSGALYRSPSLTNIKITSLKRNPSKDRKKKAAADIEVRRQESDSVQSLRHESEDDKALGDVMVSLTPQLPIGFFGLGTMAELGPTGALARMMYEGLRDPAISLQLHAESPESALAVQNLHKNSYATGYGYGFGGQG